MKYLVALLMFCGTAQAKEYKFKWIEGRDMLQYKTEASDWHTAFERAADFCFRFLREKEPNASKLRKEEMIDTCANPEKGSYDL